MLFPQVNIQAASVDKFAFMRPRLLIGALLQDVKALQNSITRFGLLSPIIVRKHNGRLIVVDGRKRLTAIRRLSFIGQLPRSLVNIPFIELKDVKSGESPIPALMSNRDLYMAVTRSFASSNDTQKVAEDLYLSRRCVGQILTLSRLSSHLRGLFFDRVIDFHQAKTYAAEPRHAMQNAAFQAAGPFASIDEIRAAVQDMSTQTVERPPQTHVLPIRRAA